MFRNDAMTRQAEGKDVRCYLLRSTTIDEFIADEDLKVSSYLNVPFRHSNFAT